MAVHKKEEEIGDIRGEPEFQDERRPSIKRETSFLSLEQIEEFFQATEDGSVERLKQLFDRKIKANPNMTYFTESLLMAAIRRNRNEVADYLIDQLAIDVQYSADLREFRLRSRAPFRHRTFSCRDLAYEKGMMELVDLIDLTSNDVTPNIKRYLKTRLQPRLNHIHQAYLERLEEQQQQQHLLFQSNKEQENREAPTENITDENIKLSFMQTESTHRPCKSYVEEIIENLDASTSKSIDETGKKNFRFSNYTLHFRLVKTPTINAKQSPSKTTLPIISPLILDSRSLITTNSTHRSTADHTSRSSKRDKRVSISRSIQRPTLPQIVHTEKKTTSTKCFLPKCVNQNNIKYKYIPQTHALYNKPQCFMPVTLKSTAIGLPSGTRFARH